MEDETSTKGPVTIDVKSTTTVFELRKILAQKLTIGGETQNWFYKNCLLNDFSKTLKECGILSGEKLFVYVEGM